MPLSILLPLMLQIGPGGSLPQAPLQIPQKEIEAVATAPSPQTAENGILQECLQLARANPIDAIEVAEDWLPRAQTAQGRADAKQCHALALTQIENWSEAAALFLSARGDTPMSQREERARLAALAGNASLAEPNPQAALDALDLARTDLANGSNKKLKSAIEVDRAKALVALKRPAAATAALTAARTANPENAEAWLLSATLSRRQGNLAAAQTQIEKAAELLPIDPEIGLEAGVIAMLLGREDAARKSWQSVLTAAPGSDAAKTAQAYLDQLGK